MAEPWILWVLGAVLVFVVLPMFALAIHYYLLNRKTKKDMEIVDDLLSRARQRVSEVDKALQEKECSKNASTHD